MPVIGFFNSGTQAANAKNLTAFRQGLKEAGFVEGQNVAIEFRWGENQFDRLAALATEVIARQTGRDRIEHACGTAAQGRNRDHPDRVHHRQRSQSGTAW